MSALIDLSERLLRASRRGKFSCAAWEFDVVLNPRQQEIPKQKIIQINHIASIHVLTQFCAFVRQLKMFQWKIGHLAAHWSIAALKFFKENLSSNFCLIAVFVKSSVRNYQKRSALRFIIPRSHVFVFFLRLADCRVYTGHLQTSEL